MLHTILLLIIKHVDGQHFICGHISFVIVLIFFVVICPRCGEENSGETGIGKTKLKDRVHIHIFVQLFIRNFI